MRYWKDLLAGAVGGAFGCSLIWQIQRFLPRWEPAWAQTAVAFLALLVSLIAATLVYWTLIATREGARKQVEAMREQLRPWVEYEGCEITMPGGADWTTQAEGGPVQHHTMRRVDVKLTNYGATPAYNIRVTISILGENGQPEPYGVASTDNYTRQLAPSRTLSTSIYPHFRTSPIADREGGQRMIIINSVTVRVAWAYMADGSEVSEHTDLIFSSVAHEWFRQAGHADLAIREITGL